MTKVHVLPKIYSQENKQKWSNVLFKPFQLISETKLFVAEFPDFQVWSEAETSSPYLISRPVSI